MPIPRGAVSHPDPLIYSQTELINLGLAVTWDNPDVQLFRAGAPVSSWDLDPATDYEVVAQGLEQVHRRSGVGLRVMFFVLSFGIGGHAEPIGGTSIPNLGVKGGPNHPAFASITWTTPAVPGHYCIQVLLDPTDDEDYGNNLGGGEHPRRAGALPGRLHLRAAQRHAPPRRPTASRSTRTRSRSSARVTSRGPTRTRTIARRPGPSARTAGVPVPRTIVATTRCRMGGRATSRRPSLTLIPVNPSRWPCR